MVCEKCEKKLTKVACPEKWKEGTDKRKVNQNKLLNKDKRFTPYGANAKFTKILDTKSYKQSAK
ncbi:hypothetical protein MNEG_0867 [Monoraphidium neglectum]|uniref:Cysteine-rich PDZ-binding protein n=1 Tax=Monoraphidium neglectum TaxID=145388 RepID=A0A0D2K9Y0_9CHLO|nr:hypothetical protein MNEG_0867 [Monoraphidium neglectum]KIZ07078.1 hypothetical protein MNEG_0867 [Monoraphidium neglectum]|eukprot:XP_013906097.1 hypothetical protein MNEG_0867 [Monoraphidium neglectum]